MKRVRRRSAVFLDRDGVINQKLADGEYVTSWEEFHFLPGAQSAIRCLNELGFLVIVVSNQRGIARGVLTERVLQEIHEKMKRELERAGARIDGLFYCPHDDADQCACRKPQPGMLLDAAQSLDIELSSSWMIGDARSDIEAGRNAGCRTILIGQTHGKTSNGGGRPDLRFGSLAEAVKHLKRLKSRGPESRTDTTCGQPDA